MKAHLKVFLILFSLLNLNGQSKDNNTMAEITFYIDQLGYPAEDQKIFLVTGVRPSGQKRFQILDDKDQICFDGILSDHALDDRSLSGLQPYQGNFSDFRSSGVYRIKLGDSYSSEFSLASDIYRPLFRDSFRLLSLLRANRPIIDQKLGLNLPEGHRGDAHIGGRDFSGGWYNAGDFGKWTHCSAILLGNLLWSYELNEANRGDDLGIPESGNGIPDLLDESLWGLQWLLKMQNSDGSVYHKVDTEPDFAWGVPADKDPYERTVKWTHSGGSLPSSIDAGDFCAVMSLAARVFKPWYPEWSDRFRDAALLSWEWLVEYPDNPQTDPYYTDHDAREEYFWAAAEIFLLNQDPRAQQWLDQSFPEYIKPKSWQSPGLYAVTALLSSDSTPADLAEKALLRLKISADSLVAQSLKNPFLHVSESFWWSSNFNISGAAQLLLIAYRFTGDQSYRHAALNQLHYLLGRNALDLSFVSGYGKRSVKHPYHWIYYIYKVALPGWMAGGANQYPGGADPLLLELQKKGTPPALCFVDRCGSDGSWASNEGTIAMTSNLMFIAGWF